MSLPQYGTAWVEDPTATGWGVTFRSDPRQRSAAGLGSKNGIDAQDLISDVATVQAGALGEAAARIRHLTAGLSAARSLWLRRLPADPLRALAVFGPTLRRMMIPTGTALTAISGSDRPLPAALFSTAARRMLRRGPARTALARPGANDPAAVFVSANTCPPAPPRAPGSLPHADRLRSLGLNSLDDELRKALDTGRVPYANLRELVERFDRTPYSQSTVQEFDRSMAGWIDRAESGQRIPLAEILAILDPAEGKRLSDVELLRALRRLKADEADLDRDTLIGLAHDLITDKPDRPCRPVDLGRLATAVKDAIDPTLPRPFVIDRVLGTIGGIDDQPLTPPELCPDLDIPAWQLLRDHDPDWLMPGAGTMAMDSVVAMQTNPVFVDSYLLGLNTQTIGELRFRNIPVRTGCTPMRQFWSRADPAAETFLDDIVGVHLWPDASAVGDASHQTPAAAGADLVLVLRTTLFRRYPQTVVYLAPAPQVGGEPDWDAPADLANRIQPSFQGALTPEIVFFGFDLDPSQGRRFWAVLEEPPHGVQFRSGPEPGMSQHHQAVLLHPDTFPDGAAFADAAFADPYRVLIRGSALIGATT